MIPVAEEENGDDRGKVSKRQENGSSVNVISSPNLNSRSNLSPPVNPNPEIMNHTSSEPPRNYIISYNDYVHLATPNQPNPAIAYPYNYSAFHYPHAHPNSNQPVFEYHPNAHYPSYNAMMANLPHGYMHHPSEQNYPNSPRMTHHYQVGVTNFPFAMQYSNAPAMHPQPTASMATMPVLPSLDIHHGHGVQNRANSFDSTMATASLSSPRAPSRAMSTCTTPMAKSNSNQDLVGQSASPNSNSGNNNHMNANVNSGLLSPNGRLFDPLSIRDKSIPQFLDELFRPLIEVQIAQQTPLAPNFPDAHTILKNVLIEKNVKENLISYRTDTKRAKRDYRIRNFRVTLITGREIVPQQPSHNDSNPHHLPPPPLGSSSSKSKKRRNTEDSLSSRKSIGNKSSSSTDPLNESFRDSEPIIFNRNTSRDQLGEDIAEYYDLANLDSDPDNYALSTIMSYSNDGTQKSEMEPTDNSRSGNYDQTYGFQNQYEINYEGTEGFEPNKHRRTSEDGQFDDKYHHREDGDNF